MKKCPFCAEEIQDEAIVCRWCGRDVGPIDTRTENYPIRDRTITLEIPSDAGWLGLVGGGTLIFTENQVQFRGTTIRYMDVVAVKYIAKSLRQYGVQTVQGYTYMVRTNNNKISIKFSSVLGIGKQGHTELFSQLIYLSKCLVEPPLVRKIVNEIFDQHKIFTLEKLEVSSKGFRFGKNSFLWTGEAYTPDFISGNLVLYKERKGKPCPDYYISMDKENAVIVPELILECRNRALSTKN